MPSKRLYKFKMILSCRKPIKKILNLSMICWNTLHLSVNSTSHPEVHLTESELYFTITIRSHDPRPKDARSVGDTGRTRRQRTQFDPDIDMLGQSGDGR